MTVMIKNSLNKLLKFYDFCLVLSQIYTFETGSAKLPIVPNHVAIW